MELSCTDSILLQVNGLLYVLQAQTVVPTL